MIEGATRRLCVWTAVIVLSFFTTFCRDNSGPFPNNLPNCTDGIANGNETGVDCGGEDCNPCGENEACARDSDCLSEFCFPSMGICTEPSCFDGYLNGEETSVDCGGPDCISCSDLRLPNFLPCPEEWTEDVFDAGGNYSIKYCKPPQIGSDFPSTQQPVFTPCPNGWTDNEDERIGIRTCQPFPDTLPTNCDTIDQIHFPGEPGCSSVGTPCPQDSWPSHLLDLPNTYYVKAGEPSGGTGLATQPFGSINEAITNVGSNANIALSKGTYEESVELTHNIVLWGACVSETIITGDEASEKQAIIFTDAPNTTVRNLQIRGPLVGVKVSGTSPSLTLENVVIQNTQGVGVIAERGDTTIKNSVIRDTQSQQSDNSKGWGLELNSGAQMKIYQTVLYNNRDLGISIRDSKTSLYLEEVVIRDTESQQSDNKRGRGIDIAMGANVEIKDSAILNNRDIGIMAYGKGTTVQLDNVIIRKTRSRQSDQTLGRGIEVHSEAQVKMTKVLVQNNRDYGIFASDKGTSLQLEDVIVSDTDSNESDDTSGHGIQIQKGADLAINRSIILNNRVFGIVAADHGTTLNFENSVLRDTQSQKSDNTMGIGLYVAFGAHAELKTSVFKSNRTAGITADGMGTQIYLEDILVHETKSQESDKFFGRGLEVFNGAKADIFRSVFQNNRESAIFAGNNNSILNLDTVLIYDTKSQEHSGSWGYGLLAVKGAQVDIARTVIQNNREAGIEALNKNTLIKMKDVILSHTLKPQCADPEELESEQTPCFDFGRAIGIASQKESFINMEQFVISQNDQCGVQLTSPDDSGDDSGFEGIANFSHGILSQNKVCGINIQTVDTSQQQIQRITSQIEEALDNVISFQNNTKIHFSKLP